MNNQPQVNHTHKSKLKAVITLIIACLMMPLAFAADLANYAYNRIERSLQNNDLIIVTAPHGMQTKKLAAGSKYFMAVKTSHHSHIKNHIRMQFAPYGKEAASWRYMEFRLDPTLGEHDYVDTARYEDGYALIPFTFPETIDKKLSGRMEMFVQYRNENGAPYTITHLDLVDNRSHQSMIVNQGNPVRHINMNLGFYGTDYDAIVQQQKAQLIEDAFLVATKGYVALDLHIIGQQAMPEDGDIIGGTEYNYADWWQTRSQNLAGTQLAPLNSNNAKDLDLIRHAWERYHMGQTFDALEEAFSLHSVNLDKKKMLFVMDSSFYLTRASQYATVSTITNFQNSAFEEMVNRRRQFGFNQDNFNKLTNEEFARIAVNKVGRLAGLHHTTYDYQSNGENWTVRTLHNTPGQATNVMATVLDRNNTSVYFTDKEIVELMGNNAPAQLNETAMLNLEDTAHTVSESNPFIAGEKPLGQDLYINDIWVAGANDAQWSLDLDVNEPTQLLSFTLSNNAMTSATQRKVVNMVGPMNEVPEVSLEITPRQAGGVTNIIIGAQSSRGLKSTWFWVFKVENGQRRFQSKLGRWLNHKNPQQTRDEVRMAFPEAGEYQICARSRDSLYGTGTQSQSAVVCQDIVID